MKRRKLMSEVTMETEMKDEISLSKLFSSLNLKTTASALQKVDYEYVTNANNQTDITSDDVLRLAAALSAIFANAKMKI